MRSIFSNFHRVDSVAHVCLTVFFESTYFSISNRLTDSSVIFKLVSMSCEIAKLHFFVCVFLLLLLLTRHIQNPNWLNIPQTKNIDILTYIWLILSASVWDYHRRKKISSKTRKRDKYFLSKTDTKVKQKITKQKKNYRIERCLCHILCRFFFVKRRANRVKRRRRQEEKFFVYNRCAEAQKIPNLIICKLDLKRHCLCLHHCRYIFVSVSTSFMNTIWIDYYCCGTNTTAQT